MQTAHECATRNKFKAFLIISNPQVFAIFGSGNVAVAIIAKLTGYMLSLLGSYRDLFVMCVAVALTTRFQQVNKILLHNKGKSMSPNFYAEHRLYHRKLVSLVTDVDKAMSSITLLALSNNLFFICTSLLNSL